MNPLLVFITRFLPRFLFLAGLTALATLPAARGLALSLNSTNDASGVRFSGGVSITRTSTGQVICTFHGDAQRKMYGQWLYAIPTDWRGEAKIGTNGPTTNSFNGLMPVTLSTNIAESCIVTVQVGVLGDGGSWFGAGPSQYVFFDVGEHGTASPLDGGEFPDLRWYEDLEDYIADPVNPCTGEFVMAEKDLVIPGPFPFGVTRHYGSKNKRYSDFGLGWTSGLTDYLYPYVLEPGGGADPISLIRAVDGDGSVIEFMQYPPGSDQWCVNPRYSSNTMEPYQRVVPSRPSVSHDSCIYRNASGFYIWSLADGTRREYFPQAYPRQGSQRFRPYLERVIDPQGNVLKYIRGEDATRADYGLLVRIESSAGRHIDIERRDDGLIERIVTDDGREYLYGYEDEYLKTVTTPDGTVTYDVKHATADIVPAKVIGRVTRPGGRILENDYDYQRRVTAQRATVDPTQPGVPVLNATFDYTMANHTHVTDAYGLVTSYSHSGGMVYFIRAPEWRTTSKSWYSTNDSATGAYARALEKITDPRGLVTGYKYDAKGNVIETTFTGDLDGDPDTPATETHVVSAHYDSDKRLEWTVDSATGLTLGYLYEDTDYPRLATRVLTKVTATGAVLRTDQFDYTERSVPAASPATGTITARGLLEKRTLALGSPDEAVTEYDYDATGFRTSEIRRSGTADPDVAFAFTPTTRREIDTITDAANRATTFTYDGASRVRTRTVKDETGTVLAVTATTYTGEGEVLRIDGPRSGPEDWIETDYDQAGRPSEIRVWRSQARADGTGVEAPPAAELKAVTACHHDLFGNLVLTIDPRGHATTHQYDGLGRLTHTRRFDAAHAPALLAQYQADMSARRAYDGSLPAGVTVLSEETFTYEPGGKVETHTDVLGGVTTTLYNSRGQPRHRSLPDGSVRQWRYRSDGRLVKEILRDSSYWQIDYDDIARTVVRTLKKPDGTVLATETRVHDLRGNLVSLTDAAGGVFTTAYDDLDRVKTATGPAATSASAQQITTHTYDAAGIVHTVTNALGESTVTTRDALGRTTRLEIRDASGEPVRVSAWAWSPDHQAVTLTEGTGSAALATTTWSDPAGRVLLTRFPAGIGNDTFTRQTYDLGGFPVEFHDALDRVTTTTHDALGHLATRTLPAEGPGSGHLTTFVHNPAGQLLERRMASPQGLLVAKTVFDTAGRPTRSSLVNDAAETRVTTHTYHPSTHPTWAGLPATTTDPRGIVRSFAYDDFLRLREIVTDGPAPETDSTTAYAYDALGRLTSLGQSSPGDAAGPATVLTRLPDALGRTVSENVSLGGAAHSAFAQRWDEAGRRTLLTPAPPAGLADPGPYAFAHRTDGRLAGVELAGFAAAFEHDDTGLLRARANAWRRQSVDLRDSLGRIRQLTASLALDEAPLQVESQDWRADGTLDDYAVTRSAPGAWDETRDYGYDARSRVTSEGFSPAPGQTAALASTFDHGGAGLGIRTETKVAAGAPAAWQSRVPTPAGSSIDVFGRVTADQTNAAGKAVSPHGLSLGADRVELRINGSARGPASHPGWADATGAWNKALVLDAGAQTLEVDAIHPSGYTVTATRSFTVSVPLAAIASTYDAEGNVTSRSFADGRVQTLTWDAWNRLIKVTERNAANDGYDWSAVYDGLGRRLRTTHQTITAGAASGAPMVVASLYDPEAEFLEVGVVVNGAAAWKVHGPDLDGRYGGWNGTGGLEAVLTVDPESAAGAFKVKAVLTDAFGNTVATVTGLGPVQKVEWLATRVGGYGPLPNHRAEVLTSAERLPETLAWRGRRIDPTGFYWLGARYYEPHTGRFLSPDPLGHGSDMSLYAFANGDPVNRFDPTGRFSKDLWNNPYPGSPGWSPEIWTDDGYLLVAGPEGSWVMINPITKEVVGLLNHPRGMENLLTGFDDALALYSAYGLLRSAGSLSVNTYKAFMEGLRAAESAAVRASSGAESVNASAALRSKLSALEDAQQTAARTRTLPDGRIRYYEAETLASKPGPTRGAAYTTEWDPATGRVRSWMESYNHAGEVTRVHPKMLNGETLNSPHFPPTARELANP